MTYTLNLVAKLELVESLSETLTTIG